MKLGVAAILKELTKKKDCHCHYIRQNALTAERKEQKTSGEIKAAFYWGRKKPRKLHEEVAFELESYRMKGLW